MSEAEPVWTARAIYTVILLALVYAFNYFDNSILSILLPLIKQDIRLSDTSLGLVGGAAFALFYSIIGVPIARLADRSNRRNIIGLGLAFWSVMTALTGFAGGLWSLAAARFLMGAGEGCAAAPSMSMISDVFGGRQRALAIAAVTSGTALSALLLAPLAGWAGHRFGWRPVYWTAGVAGVLFAGLFLATVREPARGRWDAPVPLDGAFAALPQALRFLASQKAYVFIVLGGSLVVVAATGSLIWAPTFLVRVHHMNVAQAAAVIGPVGGALGIVGAFSAGPIVNRLCRGDERWRIWLPAMTCALVAPAQFIYLYAGALPGLVIGQGLTSLFMGMTLPLLYAVLIALSPTRIRTVGISIYLLTINLFGQVLGPLTVGALNDALGPRLGDVAIRYSLSVTACSALASGAIFLIASIWLIGDSRRAAVS